MVDLKHVSSMDLSAELARRAQDEKREQEAKRHATAIENFLLRERALDIIKHGRTSCSDSNPINDQLHHEHGMPRCNRCYILTHESPEDYLDLHISIDVSLVPAR